MFLYYFSLENSFFVPASQPGLFLCDKRTLFLEADEKTRIYCIVVLNTSKPKKHNSLINLRSKSNLVNISKNFVVLSYSIKLNQKDVLKDMENKIFNKCLRE